MHKQQNTQQALASLVSSPYLPVLDDVQVLLLLLHSFERCMKESSHAEVHAVHQPELGLTSSPRSSVTWPWPPRLSRFTRACSSSRSLSLRRAASASSVLRFNTACSSSNNVQLVLKFWRTGH